MKNIHVLPTDKPSRLYLNTQEYIFENEYSLSTDECQNKHIYITSDEEIKDGDWCIDDKYKQPMKYFGEGSLLKSSKKIILSTDQDLIKDGIQAIDDEFLEWFVKNPSCESVEVVKEGYKKNDMIDEATSYIYKIIIPKKEPRILTVEAFNKAKLSYKEPKQETLEEAAERFYGEEEIVNDYDISGYLQSAFLSGAKWQQEQNDKEAKILENILDDNYDLNVQFHKIKRECIYSFATAIYNEKLTFEEWEKKHYGNYVEQPKWQQERSYSEEEVLDLLRNFYSSFDPIKNPPHTRTIPLWFQQFKKK